MNTTLKRYIISTLVTFLVGFGLVILSQIDTITVESFKDGAFFGLMFAALRAGVKGVLELLLAKYLK